VIPPLSGRAGAETQSPGSVPATQYPVGRFFRDEPPELLFGNLRTQTSTWMVLGPQLS
jgi:hypothetical protein